MRMTVIGPLVAALFALAVMAVAVLLRPQPNCEAVVFVCREAR